MESELPTHQEVNDTVAIQRAKLGLAGRVRFQVGVLFMGLAIRTMPPRVRYAFMGIDVDDQGDDDSEGGDE